MKRGLLHPAAAPHCYFCAVKVFSLTLSGFVTIIMSNEQNVLRHCYAVKPRDFFYGGVAAVFLEEAGLPGDGFMNNRLRETRLDIEKDGTAIWLRSNTL